MIGRLRDLFPKAYIVGWKFELEGNLEEAVQEGLQQIAINRTDACVVNGSAFGPEFGFCTKKGLLRTLPTKDALSDWLLAIVSREVPSAGEDLS